MAIYVVLQYVILNLALRFKLWKIKHENTAWHGQAAEDQELDIPDWEEIKGLSHDAYLMNQRISSDTFRYKFLNYNRAWLVSQLPSVLTPRTMRRSRPYLINQLARIIGNRRNDISDDSDGDKVKYGPVALSSSSRSIVRWWLDKARRRMRLRNLVQPSISRERKAECEQCLSRTKLQVECDIDLDVMADMYDTAFPGDTEVDQVQWRNFWTANQKYKTVCLGASYPLSFCDVLLFVSTFPFLSPFIQFGYFLLLVFFS